MEPLNVAQTAKNADRAVKGFISYAHEDHAVLGQLLTHLRPTEWKFRLTFWHDAHIEAGHHWDQKIEDAIAVAEVFILLASPAFLGSRFIHDTEIPAIKRRMRVCKGKVIPVLVRDCAWEYELGAMQAVPSDNGRSRPIEDWKPRNKGYDTARDQIDKAIAGHFGLKPRQRKWP